MIIEAAEITGLSRQSIHRAIRRGLIPVQHRTAKGVYIRLDDVYAYINAPKNPGGRPRKNIAVLS